VSGIPLTDRRRALALRAALAEMVPWLAPEWAGLDQPGDFGAALYEIAARLAEESTSRLDRTPLRDKLAFLDALDLPAGAPRPATVPIVFALTEKRTTPVYAPPRVQIAAATEDDPVTFETRDALAITAARAIRLIAADPASDRIERAPASVVAAPGGAQAPLLYRLATAAEPGGKTLQLAQAVGLAGGDMLKVGGKVYRIDTVKEAIVTLLDPLEAQAPAGAVAEKVIRLESFALRNLSAHLAYVGHKELLKLDGPATIALRLDPRGLARRLSQLDIAYEIWGKPGAADEAGWQVLRPLGGGSDGTLWLHKDWEGAVEELAIDGAKSRWIRLRLLGPIADAAPPDTRTVSIELKVNSNAAAATLPKEGSRSIVSAFYNNLPLPLTTAFLPFGPEPQRFDTFAIAAPEALSKKGAAVTLAIALSDASLGTLAATAGAPDRVYGIGRNGRLQAIRFDADGAARWRQLDRPPPSAAAGGASPRLDPDGGLYAFHPATGPATGDILVARDRSKSLWIAVLSWKGDEWPTVKWAPAPTPAKQPPDSFCLLTPSPRLLAADADGLHVQPIDDAGNPAEWQTVARKPQPSGGPTLPLRLAAVAGGAGRVVAIDAAGAVWRTDIDQPGGAWTAMAADDPADPAVAPSALLHHGQVHVVLATKRAETRRVVMLRESGVALVPPQKEAGDAGSPLAIAALAADAAGPDFPLIAAVGAGQVMLWTNETSALSVHTPPRADARPCPALLAPTGSGGARLVLGVTNELLLHADLEAGAQALAFSARDALAFDTGSKAEYWIAGSTIRKIQRPLLEFAGEALLPLAPGTINAGSSYAALTPTTAAVGAKFAPKKLKLDPSDTWTRVGDYLKIGSDLYLVKNLAEDDTPPDPSNPQPVPAVQPQIATLNKVVPDDDAQYVTYARTEREFYAANRRRLLSFGPTPLPTYVTALDFDSPAKPAKQNVTRPGAQPSGENWVRVDAAWSKFPVDGTVEFDVPRSALGAWTQVPLPRSVENPDLAWDYFDGRGWRRLDTDFVDGTANLATSGAITFTVPSDLAQTEIAGKQDYWVRARLVGGDYGRPAYVAETNGNRQSISIDRSTVNPPEIITVEANYDLRAYAAPDLVLTVNNLATLDQTQAAEAAGAEFDLFQGVAAHTGDHPGSGRAIYLCLSRPPDVDLLSLYVDALDAGAGAVRLQAEVLRPAGWAAIVCNDETAGLTRPGILQLVLTTAPMELSLFGCNGWWLRLRPHQPLAGWAPVVRGLYLNAVVAEQAKSVRQEIVGTSLGAPDQVYALAEAPVIPDTLELRIVELLSEDERAALRAADPAAIGPGDVQGDWVRWRMVDSFADQEPGARVFRLDPSTGEIRFGNGRAGKIPPAGRDAIRAVSYQTGGGSRGNVPALAVNQLKTGLESVELAVNPVDAGGGADAPAKERLANTAPDRLRHARRALTPRDVEALATASSPDVVRARCLRGRGCGIDLVVAIRMTGERCPIPSRARREGIASNIAAAGWGALAPEAIQVRPPRYVHIRVNAVIIARTAAAVAQVEHDAQKAILDFLHSTDGGPGGLGWPFGRRPWPSDLHRVAAGVAGVDRVVDVGLAARDFADDLDRLAPDAVVCADKDDIALTVLPPRGTP
jgi:hypothetical protein